VGSITRTSDSLLVNNYSGSRRIIVFIIHDKHNTKPYTNSQYNNSHLIRAFTLNPRSQQHNNY